MKKFRWLQADWPLPISSISKILLAHQYNEALGHGFLLSTADNLKISGSYIEKITKLSILTDPFGNQLESTAVSYYISKFSIDSLSHVLELTDPPRSLRKFLTTLHDLLGIGLEVSEIKIDPLSWLSFLEEEFGPLLVQSISSSGISVPDNGLARVTVSGKKDIRPEFSDLIGGKFRIIDHLKSCGCVNDCDISLELARNGTAKVSGQIFDVLIDTLKKCLEKTLQ